MKTDATALRRHSPEPHGFVGQTLGRINELGDEQSVKPRAGVYAIEKRRTAAADMGSQMPAFLSCRDIRLYMNNDGNVDRPAADNSGGNIYGSKSEYRSGQLEATRIFSLTRFRGIHRYRQKDILQNATVVEPNVVMLFFGTETGNIR
jgi:hypothetical protein